MDVENKEIKKVRTNVNCPELNEDVSIYSLITENKITRILRNVISSYFHDKEVGRNPELPSIIISGERGLGKRTIGRALANSLGLTD